MNRFERISVWGFRRLQDLELKLGPLCVLIGANGGGKTSLLDVFSLLAASASGRLLEKISQLGGLTTLMTLDRAERMCFDLRAAIPGDGLAYHLEILPTGPAYTILEEDLIQQRFPCDTKPATHILSRRVSSYALLGGEQTVTRNPLETCLSQIPLLPREADEFRSRLASSTYYHVLNVEARAPVRLPQPLRPATLPGRDGEDLVSCLFYLREANRDRFEAVEDALHAAFPTFERLDFPPVAAGTLAMTWKDAGFSHPFFMHQLSEGMLRFLWLATLLQSPGLTAVTLLDEPEVSLHPELLHLLAGLMREASARTQLIVATHADRLVRFLEPSEVVTFDLSEDGMAKATPADELDLEAWLKDYTLDEVWRMGRMGGRA
ncbi:MAG: AAA family ATPase [Thermoguttaceae bacterium]|jgi:predicted ATPase